jgi:hypothetical protein
MNMNRKSFLTSFAGAIGAAALCDFSLPSLAEAQEKSRVPSKSTRIRDIEMFPYSLPMKEHFKVALSTEIGADNILVRLRTEDGVIG